MSSPQGSLLVVGGTSTIGQAVIALFASHGIPVVFTSRKPASDTATRLSARAEDLAKRHKRSPVGSIEAFEADPVSSPSLEAAVRRATEVGAGQLRYAINIAGIVQTSAGFKPIWELPMDEVRRMTEINFHAVVNACQIELAQMIKQGGEQSSNTSDREMDPDDVPFSIINVASVYGNRGIAYNSIYAATKHALLGFTKSVGHECFHLGVRMNSISPGYHITEELATAPPELLMEKCAPNGKGGNFDDLAKTFYHVAVEAKYTAGTDFPIDGGFLARGAGVEVDTFTEREHKQQTSN